MPVTPSVPGANRTLGSDAPGGNARIAPVPRLLT